MHKNASWPRLTSESAAFSVWVRLSMGETGRPDYSGPTQVMRVCVFDSSAEWQANGQSLYRSLLGLVM